MTRVKICGCMRVEDALVAKEVGADFVGLMFAPDSRRRLTVDQARAIVEALDATPAPVAVPPAEDDVEAWFLRAAAALEGSLGGGRPLTVGVFEDQPINDVNRIAAEVGLDLVQLSGREAWDDCRRAIRPAVKAIEAAPDAGVDEAIAALEPGGAIAVLLDASRGRGIPLDRDIAAAIARRVPIWVAGGLTPENVADAVREVRPWAVDVSSGVETDGAKDPEKIRAIVAAANVAVRA